MSDWILRIGMTEVNDGDERADARNLPMFASGWLRNRVPLEGGLFVLGLVHPGTGTTVLELDDAGQPIPVTAEGLAIIERIENRWPRADVSAEDVAVLSGEPVELRFLLLSRLAREGSPAPRLFHTLPWHLVTRAAHEIDTALRGVEPMTATRLRHWFTPAGSRFTAAIDQIAAGLRAGDDEAVRVGGTALCTRLLIANTERIPGETRHALCGLVETLASRDPFLRHSAALATARLRHPGQTSGEPLRLTSRLQPAASADRQVRKNIQEFLRPPFTMRLTVRSQGRLQLSVRAALRPELAAAADAYRVMLVRLTVRGDGEETPYVIPLRRGPDGLMGVASLRVSWGEFELRMDGPPIGLAEAELLTEAELRHSIRSVETGAELLPWQELSARLRSHHPLHALLGERAGNGQ
ncbi:hypothetical protein [Nonomuraea jabiensis]|uniref:Uncharacterized protein n=1 Tax=Nonomuraea jabiensis TaxID=882448 RepID=A0A7W9G8X0_9ACTN|nr:hypothetical protein [Nonomuraea jabiensis]MBB5779332.1 hypothetical protein [Nonomuraea jabiensis]